MKSVFSKCGQQLPETFKKPYLILYSVFESVCVHATKHCTHALHGASVYVRGTFGSWLSLPMGCQACTAFTHRATSSPRHYHYFFGFSLCSPGYPVTRSVDQAGLELRGMPAFGMLGLEACATMARKLLFYLYN